MSSNYPTATVNWTDSNFKPVDSEFEPEVANFKPVDEEYELKVAEFESK